MWDSPRAAASDKERHPYLTSYVVDFWDRVENVKETVLAVSHEVSFSVAAKSGPEMKVDKDVFELWGRAHAVGLGRPRVDPLLVEAGAPQLLFGAR